ncbi:MAG: methylase [Snowella sp.]|jgi:2-polyprenyl-3-methyl-5-hydroxy-6-metoxy-1,4-benzoquinol methylase|nr:MAG: methylase [Snowella sp.]
MSDIYTDGQYLNNNPTWGVEDSPWKAEQILKIIHRNSLQPNTIAEIGCGAGEILYNLSSSLHNVAFYGYEISPQAFALTDRRKKDNLHFYLDNFVDNPEVYVDMVLCIDVFEHVDDYLGFLKKLKLKGKNHIFHIPLDISISSVLRSRPILNGRKTVGHLHYFTKETALATLEDAGYKIIDYFYTAQAIELPRTQKSLITTIAKIPRFLGFKLNQDLAVRLMGGYSLIVLTQ